jgi:hypothetical protein
LARLYEPRRQQRSLRKNINTGLTKRIEAQKDVSPLVRTSRAEEMELLEGEEPSMGYLFRILIRSASSVSKQAASLPTIWTMSASKRTVGTKTNCLWTRRLFPKRICNCSLRITKAPLTTRKQKTKP